MICQSSVIDFPFATLFVLLCFSVFSFLPGTCFYALQVDRVYTDNFLCNLMYFIFTYMEWLLKYYYTVCIKYMTLRGNIWLDADICYTIIVACILSKSLYLLCFYILNDAYNLLLFGT